MPSLLQRILTDVGTSVGSFQRALVEARTARRPRFLGAVTQEGRWNAGDLGQMDAAQQRAIRNSWLYTAITMISREVSAAKLEMYENRGDEDTEDQKIPNHELLSILLRPNPWMGRSYLWTYTAHWLLLDGNSYWFKAPDQNGYLAELWPMPANRVEPWPGDEHRFVDYYEYTANGVIYQIPSEYVVHFQLPNPYDVFRGLSPLVAAILPTDADSAMALWNGAFFGNNNVMPSAVINLASGDPDAPIDESDVERVKDELQSDYIASERKTLVTNAPGGVNVQLLSYSAKDMDFLGGREFTREEIFSIYGIPGGLLAKNATEANAQTADRVFKEKTIWPLLTLLAEQITSQLVEPEYSRKLEARFEDIRPTNRKQEMEEVDRARGVLTINEVRTKYYNLEPLGDGRGNLLYGQTPEQEALDRTALQVQNADLDGTEAGSETHDEDDPILSAPVPKLESPKPPVDKPEPDRSEKTTMVEGSAGLGGAVVTPQTIITEEEHPEEQKGRGQDGAMLAFMLPKFSAESLDILREDIPEGAELLPLEDLHITLAYLGKVDEIENEPQDVIDAIVASGLLNDWFAMYTQLSGYGVFESSEEDGASALYLKVDSLGLMEFRERMVKALEKAGIEYSRKYDFNPHVTLAYLPKGMKAPELEEVSLEVIFRFLTLAWGGVQYPLLLQGEREDVKQKKNAIERTAIEAEMKRWRDKSYRAIKAGKTADVEFESDVLPDGLLAEVHGLLAEAETIKQVKSIFTGVDLLEKVYRGVDDPALLQAIKGGLDLLDEMNMEEESHMDEKSQETEDEWQ